MADKDKPLSSLVRRILDEYDARVSRFDVSLPTAPGAARVPEAPPLERPRPTRSVRGPMSRSANAPLARVASPPSRPRFEKPTAETPPTKENPPWVRGLAQILQIAIGVFLGITMAKFIPGRHSAPAESVPKTLPGSRDLEPTLAAKKIPSPLSSKPKPAAGKPKPKPAAAKLQTEPIAVKPKQKSAPPAPVPAVTLEPSLKIPFPANWPRGLVVEGFHMLSVDRRSGKIVEIDPKRTPPRREIPFPNRAAESLSLGDRGLWSVDSALKRIYLHDPETFAVTASFAAPGERPSALCADAGGLWSADQAAGRVYRHDFDGKNLSLAGAYPIEETAPVALARRGDDLWILDGKTLRVGRYRLGEALRRTGSADLGALFPEGTQVRSFTIDGKYAWVLTESPAYLHRLDAGRLVF